MTQYNPQQTAIIAPPDVAAFIPEQVACRICDSRYSRIVFTDYHPVPMNKQPLFLTDIMLYLKALDQAVSSALFCSKLHINTLTRGRAGTGRQA
jgi:hypothetical protein